MGCKGRMKTICRVKYVIIFCLVLLCIWWGRNAVLRYLSQPLSTDISFKYGEFEQGIQFPLITLCNWNIFRTDPIIKECHDGSWNFISTLISCMKRNKTSHMQNFHPEIGNIVEMVQFWTGSKYINVQHLDEKIWTRVFLDSFGPCYMFDLSKVEKLSNVSIEAGKKPGIEFVMAENNPWQRSELIVHSRFDLPFAWIFVFIILR